MTITTREKLKISRKKSEAASVLGGLWDFVLGAFKALGAIENRLEKSLEKHKKAFQGWLVKVIVTGLSVFMSLAFLILGLFFIAIDYGEIPRGVVFNCGGLFGLLVLGFRISRK
jgi:hypothetical protein